MSASAGNGLPFNLDDVIHRRRIEDNRVEFQATWDGPIRAAVVRTVCALANDLLNLNGGYILLGIEEEAGRPVLPPRGLDGLDLDLVQKEVHGACQRINPPYQPILFPVEYQGRAVLLIWAPAGETRPYQAPEDANAKKSPAQWFVRQGPMTVAARGETLRQLMETAGRTPFDDRRNLQARPVILRYALPGLLAALGAAGCGRAPETSRFVPAAGGTDRPAGAPDQARPEVRKIEMH